jgi:hypothetical protein
VQRSGIPAQGKSGKTSGEPFHLANHGTNVKNKNSYVLNEMASKFGRHVGLLETYLTFRLGPSVRQQSIPRPLYSGRRRFPLIFQAIFCVKSTLMLSKTISVKILMIRIASAVYAIRLASATTQRFLLIAGMDLQTY